MINKRLLSIMEKEKNYTMYLVFLKIVSLLLNVWMIFTIGGFIEAILFSRRSYYEGIVILGLVLLLQIFVTGQMFKLSNSISGSVKKKLRVLLFDKIYSYGMKYSKKFNIAEVAHLSVNAIESLEVYFSSFLPQLLYSVLSPLILFVFVSSIDIKIAFVLLAMIPLIPMAILVVQKLAKKVNSQYWGSYTDLSEVFVDFLEGLTTLIIFNADEDYNNKLNTYAKDFRKKTMRVLSMQLNNITAMDLIAYAGASIGIILTVSAYYQSTISLGQAIIIILLSSEFFLPLRMLGSFFHIAMNGMGAVDQLFEILDMPMEEVGTNFLREKGEEIQIEGVEFSYQSERKILKEINMEFKKGEIAYIVGESGCGKSTVASLIMNKISPQRGEIFYNSIENLKEDEILRHCTMVTNNPYLFKGTLKYNLQMGNEKIKNEQMWEILEKLSLKEYFERENGLNTLVGEKGNNFSGGQKQRIAIARAILKDSPIYIFDEATSNIDDESEDIIMKLLRELKKDKLIIIISHRLKHTKTSDYIYYMKDGRIWEHGNFYDLMEKEGLFKNLYDSQIALENWGI